MHCLCHPMSDACLRMLVHLMHSRHINILCLSLLLRLYFFALSLFTLSHTLSFSLYILFNVSVFLLFSSRSPACLANCHIFVTGFVPPLPPLPLCIVLHPPSPVTATCHRRSSSRNPKFVVFLLYVSYCLFRSRFSTFNLLLYMC